MEKSILNQHDGINVIDGKGYYAEQFLCRQTVTQDAVLTLREEILDKIYLAVNMIEEVAPKGLNSKVLDVSTQISGMVPQLKLRGFENVAAISEDANHAKKLSAECKGEGWKVPVQIGGKIELAKLDPKVVEGKMDVVLFMDSRFNSFAPDKAREDAIRNVSKILSNNGVIIFDLSNPIERIRNMQLIPQWAEDDRLYRLSRETLDPLTMEYTTTLVVIPKDGGGKEETTEKGYLIHLNEFRDLLQKCGLTIKKVYGNYEQEPYTVLSSRLIVLAGKINE